MSESRPSVDTEAEAIRNLIANTPGDPLERRRYNLEGELAHSSEEQFWKELVMSLLSSQQRSSADSPIERFRAQFALDLPSYGTLTDYAVDAILAKFRFHRRITKQLRAGYEWLCVPGNGWISFETTLHKLLQQRNVPPSFAHQELEREAAQLLDDQLPGLGPKQARNLLQALGLTRYEIPLDSRVVSWLQENLGWGIFLAALADRDYYEDLLDRVQAACARAEVLPALFDAAAFVAEKSSAKPRRTTTVGYVNRNGQVVIRDTRLPGTDKNQYVYQLGCSLCGEVYGANGSDIHLKLCPQCQDGARGLPQ